MQTIETKPKYIPTTEKVTVENYPYGYSLRTTLFDTIEFHPKKGYRHVTQTINPKNGRLNAPKKSTYSLFMFRVYDEKGHIKIWSSGANGDKDLNKCFKFFAEHYDILNDSEKAYLRIHLIGMLAVSWKASQIYTKVPIEICDEVYLPLIDKLKENTDLLNIYSELYVNVEKLDKDNHGYRGFETVETFTIG